MRVAPALVESSRLEPGAALARAGSGERGLDDAEAARRLAESGPNDPGTETTRTGWTRFLNAVRNPLVVLLAVLAAVSAATGDLRAAVVMGAMLALGVGLRLVQETRADGAAARLRAMIRVTATVVRGGAEREVPLRALVPGDVVRLAAGDMVPADVRVLQAKDLFVNQSSLTGESVPVEKHAGADADASRPPLEAPNCGFLGTSVDSGSATALVVATGRSTYFGAMARGVAAPGPRTAFDLGVDRFAWLMLRLTAAMVPVVFVLNGLTKHDWREAFLFSLAVAVGLTPEMLPMVVSVCLARGAIAMSRQRVVVKRLGAIQDLGAMDVLCSDKTGTLTQDRVILERYCDVELRAEETVLHLAYLISHFQTGLRNVLDRAILEHRGVHAHLGIDDSRKLDEIPFDFVRRVMSVVVETPDGVRLLLAKGAPEEVFRRCDRFELAGEVHPMDPARLEGLRAEYERLNDEGFRVLAVAYKDLGEQSMATKADEAALVLKGYVAFLDPPKESAGPALAALAAHGVSVKVLTGDNPLVTRKVCRDVGLDAARVVTGPEVEAMDDAALADCAETNAVFARLTPAHKRRLIAALRSRGHVVGFLGDGINDAPALRAADVGISVDTAVDVARESADVILLEKSLLVLDAGVREGRKVFANLLKYVRMGASSNFGNMLSVLGASAFLPFVPMAPIQVLANNLLYDASQAAIPGDAVDDDQVARPRPWAVAEIRRFILLVGPLSSVFDYTTYWALLRWFGWDTAADAASFRSGWFVESVATQALVIHVIRTNRVPFAGSRASGALTATTLGVVALGAWLPQSPLAGALGFAPLPASYWPFLAGTVAAYLGLTLAAKAWMVRRGWIR